MEKACMESNTSFTCSVLVDFMYLAGVPTLRQQAELFIRSLRLGTNADEPTDNPATKPTTQPTPQMTHPLTTQPPSQTTHPPPKTTLPPPKTTLPPFWTTQPTYCLRRKKRMYKNIVTYYKQAVICTTAPPYVVTDPYRGRRQIPIPAGSDYCPSLTEQANNRICHNVCPRGM